MTVGRIFAGGKDRGSGFALATSADGPSRVVLTANHVVRDHDVASLEFRCSAGPPVPVERVEADEGLDVAVLHLADDVTEALAAACAWEDLAWQVPARPRGNDPKLTGTVTDADHPFENAKGREGRALQLRVNETLGDYGGYSGSPVLFETAVVGVLVEQLRWRVAATAGQGRTPASNVLYAVPIEDVLARFGLDAIWAAVPAPLAPELVRSYLRAFSDRVAQRYGSPPHIALELERGTRAPAAAPSALSREQEKLRALLEPRFSPVPPDDAGRAEDAGRSVADLWGFVAEHKRVVLLGKPGAGKSTTLRHIVGSLGAPWSTAVADDKMRIPFLVDLSEWHDDALDLVAFLQSWLHRLGQRALARRLPDLMRDGRAVLLLDGLNEIPRLGRDPATGCLDDPRVAAIAALGTRPEWSAVPCVLSCRPRDFAGGPTWHDLYLRDLDDDRVAAFAQAFLHGAPHAPALTHDFLRDLSGSARLQGVLVNPFFLVKALAYYSVVRTVPDSLADLLRFSVAEALERERLDDRSDELQRRLGRLAFAMAAEGRFGAVDRRAAAWLASDAVLDRYPSDLVLAADVDLSADVVAADAAWRAAEGAGLLIATDEEVRFSHQLFQEFLAAHSLWDRPLTAERLETAASPHFDEIRSLWAGLDPGLVERLVGFLGDPGPEMRGATAAVLGSLGDRRAADALARALDDADVIVRERVAVSLAALNDRRAVPVLVEELVSSDDGARRVAAHLLGRLRDPRAVAPLVQVLEGDGAAFVRAAAATALGLSGDGRAFHPLVRALVGDRERNVSMSAADALGELRDPRAVPDLLARLDDSGVERGVARGLLALGDAALDPLIDVLLHEGRAKRRERAAFVLGLSRRPRVVPTLVAALRDRVKDVRFESASALGHFGEPALAPLIELLDGDDEQTQHLVLYALGVMADPRAVPHLLTALRSGSEGLAQRAARSLRSVKGAAVGPLVGRLHGDGAPQTRWYPAAARSDEQPGKQPDEQPDEQPDVTGPDRCQPAQRPRPGRAGCDPVGPGRPRRAWRGAAGCRGTQRRRGVAPACRRRAWRGRGPEGAVGPP